MIGFAGRFVEEKRPDVLIKALSQIDDAFPGTRAVFAGEYDIKYEDFYERNQSLIEANRDKLIFLGLIDDSQELANFYAAIDLLALPSDTECFALVQVEAMRSGTPVVSTDIPGAREVVKVTGMGRVVVPSNPNAFAEGVIEVLQNRTEFVKSLAEIDSTFNLEETIDRYERHLRFAAESAMSR